MQIDSEKLPAQLQRGLAPLYVVHGEETLLAIEAADRIRAAARALGYTERELFNVEAHFKWQQIKQSSVSLSLFASKRILEIRITSGAPGVEGAEALVQYAADLPPDTLTLVSLPRLDKRARETKWFAALESAGVAVHAQRVNANDLPQWLAGRLKAQHHSADQATLEYIATRTEGNLLAALQEVQKLALLFPPGKLEFEAIKQSIAKVARYDVFGMSVAVLKGDTEYFLRMIDGLRAEGTAPPLVLWVLGEEARSLYSVKLATERGVPAAQAMRDARVWGERQSVFGQALKRHSLGSLQQLILRAARIDRIAKGVARGEPWDELRLMGLKLANPALALPEYESR